MGFLVVALLLVLALGAAVWIAIGVVGLVLTLVVAGLVGWAADAVIPGALPGGWLGAVLAGIAGGFLGRLLIGSVGPELFGVQVLPAFIGALVIVAAVELVNSSRARRSLR